MTALRVIQGDRGATSSQLVTVRESVIDDLQDEITALEAEAAELVGRALPLAHQLRLMATALGPTSGLIAQDLIDLLERHERRHLPRRAA